MQSNSSNVIGFEIFFEGLKKHGESKSLRPVDGVLENGKLIYLPKPNLISYCRNWVTSLLEELKISSKVEADKESFSYLGQNVARVTILANTNKIPNPDDMIDVIPKVITRDSKAYKEATEKGERINYNNLSFLRKNRFILSVRVSAEDMTFPEISGEDETTGIWTLYSRKQNPMPGSLQSANFRRIKKQPKPDPLNRVLSDEELDLLEKGYQLIGGKVVNPNEGFNTTDPEYQRIFTDVLEVEHDI